MPTEIDIPLLLILAYVGWLIWCFLRWLWKSGIGLFFTSKESKAIHEQMYGKPWTWRNSNFVWYWNNLFSNFKLHWKKRLIGIIKGLFFFGSLMIPFPLADYFFNGSYIASTIGFTIVLAIWVYFLDKPHRKEQKEFKKGWLEARRRGLGE